MDFDGDDNYSSIMNPDNFKYSHPSNADFEGDNPFFDSKKCNKTKIWLEWCSWQRVNELDCEIPVRISEVNGVKNPKPEPSKPRKKTGLRL